MFIAVIFVRFPLSVIIRTMRRLVHAHHYFIFFLENKKN